ncbi:uncharacterized protein LOC112552580 [Pogonomyrmex barbatus]|uniref:Uncharacterized protein LOC112552580 n=1 Tax=Pogonomyrmex barbatus TaxID=144034 RepID=A0A8N1S771_9HYME|nr:uncharacterized protein LOC112552580 [Pogonomyrmex barbatus]
MEQLQYICNELSDKNEIDIIKRYGSNAKRYTVTLLILVVLAIPVFILYQLWPLICDILFPINETRPLSLLFITEYFVDQEKYYYLILIHANAATFIGVIALIATGTMFIAYLLLACGMFRIASYRIERAMAIDMLHKNSLEKKSPIYKGLICGVDMHRKAMKFSDLSISKFKVMFFLMLVVGVICTAINYFRFTIFLTSKCTSNLLINVLSSTLFYIVLIIKYGSFSMNIKVIKDLLEQIQYICNELSNDEIDIMKRYGCNVKHYTITLLLLVIFVTCVFILYPFWPLLSDILFPINETRSHLSLLFITEYFVDQEKYYYLIVIHANAATFIGTVAMLATGTILIAYQLLACGMFRIASYRFEQAMTIDTLHKNNLEKKILIYKGLICGVDMHRKAMKFSDLSVSKFKVMFFLMIIAGVMCTAINYFLIFQMVSFGFNIEKFFLPVIFALVHTLYLFIGGQIGQQIIDHNNDVLDTVYNIRWYIAPLQIQKMILFLLQKGCKVFNLNIAGLIVGSFEGVATLMSTTLSYFTVLYSTQNK